MLKRIRKEISKWLMRTENAGRLLSIPLRLTTASGVLTLALEKTSLSQYTFVIVPSFVLAMIAFIWGYDVFRVLNIQNQYDADRSDNYAGPTTAINQMVNAVQFAVLAEGLQEDWSSDKIHDEMKQQTREELSRYRDGINISELYD